MKRIALLALASGMAIAAAAPASAAVGISVTIGANTITLANSNAIGAVGFMGTTDGTVAGTTNGANAGCTIGSANCYYLNLSGSGFPAITQPGLQTTSVSAQYAGTAASTLILNFTQTGLSPFTGTFTSGFTDNNRTGSALTGSISLATLLDGNALSSVTYGAVSSATNNSDSFVVGGRSLVSTETARYTMNFGTGAGQFNSTINISATAVPEPATWGMMIMGFGLMGGVLRRRSTKVAFA